MSASVSPTSRLVNRAARRLTVNSGLAENRRRRDCIFQLPGLRNALAISCAMPVEKQIAKKKKKKKRLKQAFPTLFPGLHNLLTSLGLFRRSFTRSRRRSSSNPRLSWACLVIFLQTWRASIIPLMRDPRFALSAAFAAMKRLRILDQPFSLFGASF